MKSNPWCLPKKTIVLKFLRVSRAFVSACLCPGQPGGMTQHIHVCLNLEICLEAKSPEATVKRAPIRQPSVSLRAANGLGGRANDHNSGYNLAGVCCSKIYSLSFIWSGDTNFARTLGQPKKIVTRDNHCALERLRSEVGILSIPTCFFDVQVPSPKDVDSL